MRFRSSRNPHILASFGDAVFDGLAPDGGLYVPEVDLDFSAILASLTPQTSFGEVARLMTRGILGEDFDDEGCAAIARNAFTFEPKLVEIRPGVHVVELFHGPSCAFKDFGACFLAATMDELLARRGGRATVLVATSGDTGSAVAEAFHQRENVRVLILYPSGRVSELQEKQLTTVGGNVTALEVDGSFDDCQRMVKEGFGDRELRDRMNLTSANSINVGRLLPQSFYYAYAWAASGAGRGEAAPTFVVPSGNLGNLTSGLYAWRWGMPARAFVAATNVNDVLPEYLATGEFRARPSTHTLSNAMDVGDPSNMERIVDLFAHDVAAARTMLRGEAVTDEQTLEAMREVHGEYDYVLDPHTAVGWVAMQRATGSSRGPGPVLLLATAHPAKFGDTVRRAIATDPVLPRRLAVTATRSGVSVPVGNRVQDLKEYLLD